MAKTKTLRVHTLAKELGVTSKQLIEKCHAEGIELKNHMAAISLGLAESIREWFSADEDVTSVEVAAHVDAVTIRKAEEKRARLHGSAMDADGAAAVATEEESLEDAVATAVADETELALPAEADVEVSEEVEPVVAEPETTPVAEAEAPVEVEASPEEPAEAVEPGVVEPAAEAKEEEPVTPAAEVKPPEPPTPIEPMGPQLVPAPAEVRGPRVVRIEAPEPVRPLRPRPAAARWQPPGRGPAPAEPPATTDGARRGGRGRRRVRDDEQEGAGLRSRSPRRSGRGDEVRERVQEWREQDIQERRERLASATGHGLKERRAAEQRRAAAAAAAAGAAGRKAPVTISTPISVKDFCASLSVPFSAVSKKLLEHTGRMWTINQSLDSDTAELVALELGIAVKVAKQKTALERLREEFAERERKNLKLRPPVVAMLGHVDHGKTSLLDAIRKTRVVDGESGGITQHIGAYQVEREGWRVTFLDTPGHAAFTAMRARGANLTDVVVLVVAADDGVMPQTVEALNHARAAGVQIVVALNKIDLPNADLDRTYGQLSQHELTPSEWGGQTDVIKTSATTGQGVDELIAHLSTLSELLDLKADPSVPVQGTVIEARMREGRGNVAQVLVREGTLKTGQIIVCGGAAGRVRVLRDSHGRTIKEALPGMPVEVSGLDWLPQTGDQLYQLKDLKLAKEIAAETRQQLRSESLEMQRKPRTLEDLLAAGDEAQVPQLNVIIRADVQGSVDVLKKSLGEFPSDKAVLRVLQAGVGAISETDVQLAQASDAIVIGFGVVAEDRARQLADQVGVEIRLYRVIYEILDDMHKALAGLLEPTRREEVRGAAEVRQVFNITRLGTVAGCYVTNGTVMRNHLARLVRDGRLVVERTTLHSLKRFKDDAREVRTGMECGIKLEGYDDIKPGDVIETYEVIEELQEL